MEKVRKHTGRKEEEEWWHCPILNRHFSAGYTQIGK